LFGQGVRPAQAKISGTSRRRARRMYSTSFEAN
jgi:hypothetical protein